MVVEGARWRQEQKARLVIMGAWETANLSRHKRLPNLEKLLSKIGRRERQTPQEQEALLREFASRCGLKVERHEHPVI